MHLVLNSPLSELNVPVSVGNTGSLELADIMHGFLSKCDRLNAHKISRQIWSGVEKINDVFIESLSRRGSRNK